MTINLYNNTTDPNGINKNLTSGISHLNCHLKENTSIAKPTFILVDSPSQNVSTFNYCYCPDFNRYYFIETIIKKMGGIIEVVCLECDVLETYKQYFLERECFIERCERTFKNENNAMSVFFDNEYPIRSDVTFENVDIGNVATGRSYILTTNGGVQ